MAMIYWRDRTESARQAHIILKSSPHHNGSPAVRPGSACPSWKYTIPSVLLSHGKRREFKIMSRFWFVRDSIDNWAKLLPLSIYGATSSSSACTYSWSSALEYNLQPINHGIMWSAQGSPQTFFTSTWMPFRADLNPSEPCLPPPPL